jgi:GNAT superfamily N-acetyltransferase
MTGPLRLEVSPPLTDAALNALFSGAWPGRTPTAFAPRLARSLAWIAAFRGDRLVGYVNVVGDGGVHAFLLDTTVHPGERRRGLGTRLVEAASGEAARLGAAWLHVDYEPELAPFYAECGFGPTAAGLRRLR